MVRACAQFAHARAQFNENRVFLIACRFGQAMHLFLIARARWCEWVFVRAARNNFSPLRSRAQSMRRRPPQWRKPVTDSLLKRDITAPGAACAVASVGGRGRKEQGCSAGAAGGAAILACTATAEEVL